MKGGVIVNKVKNFVNRHKSALAVSAVSASLAVTSAVSAFAVDGAGSTTSNVKDQFSTAVSGIQSDLMGYILIVVPIALGILGAIFGIKKAISFFKTMANKAG